MAVNNVKNPAQTGPARPEIVNAIKQASARTGVDFNYLLQNAAAESNLNPTAHSATSSARGLYQFVESTWLDTVDRHGAAHGLQKAAAAITRDASGKPVVNDPAMRKQILALRDDPRVASLMAAELTKDNRATLETTLGRKVDHNELYMAHFLGASGARKLLTEGAAAPSMPAAELFPKAARANAAMFTDAGKPLAVAEVQGKLNHHFNSALPAIDRQRALSAMALEMMKTLSAATADPVRDRHWKA